MDPKMVEEVKDKMKDGGTVPPRKAGPFSPQTRGDARRDVNDYGNRMYEWGRAVRRDILVLEYHLKKLGVNPNDLYGDPGDPPPPPPE